jgi:hypothetical protein
MSSPPTLSTADYSADERSEASIAVTRERGSGATDDPQQDPVDHALREPTQQGAAAVRLHRVRNLRPWAAECVVDGVGHDSRIGGSLAQIGREIVDLAELLGEVAALGDAPLEQALKSVKTRFGAPRCATRAGREGFREGALWAVIGILFLGT